MLIIADCPSSHKAFFLGGRRGDALCTCVRRGCEGLSFRLADGERATADSPNLVFGCLRDRCASKGRSSEGRAGELLRETEQKTPRGGRPGESFSFLRKRGVGYEKEVTGVLTGVRAGLCHRENLFSSHCSVPLQAVLSSGALSVGITDQVGEKTDFAGDFGSSVSAITGNFSKRKE